MDRRRRTMIVKFNMSYYYPLIIEGWTDVRNFMGIQGNKMMLMTYCGNNRFLIEVHPSEFNLLNLPAYHTYRFSGLQPDPWTQFGDH